MRKKVALSVGCLLLACGGCSHKPSFSMPSTVIEHPSSSSPHSSESSSWPVPDNVLIRVPFSPQAPFAHWDHVHEEACEEMSLLLVHHYLAGTPLSMEEAETELQTLLAWEVAHGYAEDVTATQLGAIAGAYFGHQPHVLVDLTAAALRQQLAQGHPVIVPAAGRLLGNPYFSGAGPAYHMLVVTGYTDGGFITNDPGTRRGEQYWYATDVLLRAVHDWTGDRERIEEGAKNALVLN